MSRDLISSWVEQHGTLAHDGQTIPAVLHEIPIGGTVIDVGAHIGDSGFMFAGRIGDMGWLWAFEPYADAFECLRRNAQKFFGCNYRCFDVALGDSEGMADLAVDADNTGASYITAGLAIRTSTLDSFNLPRCDFIKIDVEGYELRVLKGAEHTINRFHPKMLIEVNRAALERQGTDFIALYAWLKDHGYESEIVQPGLSTGDQQYDILCKYAGVSSEAAPSTEIDTIRSLAEQLKKFCGNSASTRAVRLELHKQGVIQLPYRFKRRKKWRKRKAKA